MLLWGVFTLGYIFGVGITLWFAWPARHRVEEQGKFKREARGSTSWEIFRSLTAVNYPQAPGQE